MAVIVSIWAWIMANIPVIVAVIGGLIALDEVLIKAIGASQSSVLSRVLEILGQVKDFILKFFPSQGSPPSK